MAYSTPADLLTGNIPVPQYIDKDKFVADAADEIDSKIGFRYLTPIDVSSGSAVEVPVRLLLKRISNFLATGRLLMAADAGGENDRLHAYGWSLVKEATAALDAIANGDILLGGATPVDTDDEKIVSSVIVLNEDPESNVSAFYDRIANPAYSFGFGRFSESEGLIRGR